MQQYDRHMENKDVARKMDNISNNFYSEKRRLKKMLQLPYTQSDTSSEQYTVKNTNK